MIRSFTALIFLFAFANMLQAQEEINLYDKVPNSKQTPNKEQHVVSGGILRISDVSIPTITIYKPSVQNEKKTAVIICPGGGYARLAASHEGSDVARAFNEWGITAFVLKYRLPGDSIMIDKTIGPLQDAQRAIQMVRENTDKWNIDPAKVGIMGFSAGGHLAATASTHFDHVVIGNPKGTSVRPDFSILLYAVISFTDSLTHWGSRRNLIGKNASNELVKEYSNELQVSDKTPTAFLVHAGDDKTVNVENSIRYFEALHDHHILAELHIYLRGGHGFGMNNKTTNDKWMERLRNWLQENGLL